MYYLHYIYYSEMFPQVRRHMVHTMVGGGEQHGGYASLDYRKIHQGNAGKLGNYPILSVLPDKFTSGKRWQARQLPHSVSSA